MTTRPVIFNAAMVRAILDGTKSVTRRVIKPKPYASTDEFVHHEDGTWQEHGDLGMCNGCRGPHNAPIRCPFGVPGDKLYVRETWAPYRGCDEPLKSFRSATCARYAADNSVYLLGGDTPPTKLDSYALAPHREMPGGPWPWRPSIHMPKFASRITLEVTDVRVERVQDISEEDAKAEGVGAQPHYFRGPEPCLQGSSYRDGFRDLWDSIAKPGERWAANPWVFAVSFKRLAP